MKNKGFSLAEVVITLAIIGVVATLTMSTVFRHRPNQEMLMLKKVYYLTGRIVNELINDEDLYPANAVQAATGTGFSYTDAGRYHGVTYGGGEHENDKFCMAFAARMNVRGTDEDAVQCNAEHSGQPNNGELKVGTYTTVDNVVWYMPISAFRGNHTTSDVNEETGVNYTQNEVDNENSTQSIYIDVNGNDGPNCLATTFADTSTCSPNGPDRFEIHVDRWGKISPVGEVSQEYLATSNNAMSYREIKARFEKQNKSTAQ